MPSLSQEERADPTSNVGNASKLFPGQRHIQFLQLFTAIFLGYGMRTNLSVAIIAMTSTDRPSSSGAPTYPEWKNKQLILSSFFWGYVIPQTAAGYLSRRLGAKWPLAIAMLTNALSMSLIPIMSAVMGEAGLIVCRVIQGLSQGFIYPCVHHLLGQWTPLRERSRIASFVYSSGPLGNVIAMPVTGLLCDSVWGWPGAFYVYGIASVLWACGWMWLGHDSPAQDSRVHPVELAYIRDSQTISEEKSSATPWASILRSAPVWAILVTQCGQNWGFWTLLTEIPSYMDNILHYPIAQNSFVSALPYLVMWLLSFVFSIVSDWLINGHILSIGAARKLFNSIGLLVPAAALLALGFVDVDQGALLAISLLVVAVGANAAVFSGYNVNHIDLSPNYAGTLMGLTNGTSNLVSILAPLAIQAFGGNEKDPILWRNVFCTAAGIYVVADIFFILFGSGEVQRWNIIKPTSASETKSA